MTDKKREAQARERFAANLESLRQGCGLSLDVLADRAELGDHELARILNGEIEVRAGTIYLLAGAPGVESGELFSGIAWVPPADEGDGYVIDDPADP
jgi:transcriptional regulator with XRE-family HTH domain